MFADRLLNRWPDFITLVQIGPPYNSDPQLFLKIEFKKNDTIIKKGYYTQLHQS